MSDNDDGTIPLIRLAESYADVAPDVTPATSPPIDRAKWLAERSKGIGGSDVGAIMKVDPYRTPLDVFFDKTSGGTDIPDNAHMQRGRKLEALVADEYLIRHPEDSLSKTGMLVHPVHKWMIGNPDRIITSPSSTYGGKGVLEIKTPARPAFELIRLKGVPARYLLQMQHYLALTGYNWGVFAIFNADAWELMLIPVQAWSKEMQGQLIEVLKDFWEKHVVPCVPPLSDAEPPRIELPKIEGTLRTREDVEFARAVESYESASAYVKEAEALKEAARTAVLETINMEPGVYENDSHRVYYTSVAGRKSFDKKALAQVAPLDPMETLASISATLRLDNDEVAKVGNALMDARLDLSQFEKQGNDFMTMRVYPLTPESK